MQQGIRFVRSTVVSQSMIDPLSNTPAAFCSLLVIADPLFPQRWIFAPTSVIFSAIRSSACRCSERLSVSGLCWSRRLYPNPFPGQLLGNQQCIPSPCARDLFCLMQGDRCRLLKQMLVQAPQDVIRNSQENSWWLLAGRKCVCRW